jgi:hypothetical protein
MSTTTKTETARNAALPSAPAGFRRATAADLTDRPGGWVGPKIHAPYLVKGRPETAAVLTWAPEDGLCSVLNADIYPAGDSFAADDAFQRLDAMLEYAALESVATSPSELASAYRASSDNAYNFPAPWGGGESQELVLNAHGESTLTASPVMGGGVAIGVHLAVSFEDFESLGLDVCADAGALELTGTREEIAAAAELFAEMGRKLSAFLAPEPVE